jgi:hypothetical protein
MKFDKVILLIQALTELLDKLSNILKDLKPLLSAFM